MSAPAHTVSVRNSHRGSHRGSAPQDSAERSVSRAATHSPVLDGLGSGPVIPRAASHNDRVSANRAQGVSTTQPPVRALHMESMHTGQGPHLLTGREGFQTDRALENRRGRRIARQMHNIRHHCVPLHVERGLPGPGPGKLGWGRSLGGCRRYTWLCAAGEEGSNDVSCPQHGGTTQKDEGMPLVWAQQALRLQKGATGEVIPSRAVSSAASPGDVSRAVSPRP